MEWWTYWTDNIELLARLEILVEHSRILINHGLVDMHDEVSSARREYKDIVGPSRKLDLSDVLRKKDRGWCWRNKESEGIQASLSLKSLEGGLAKARKNCEGAQEVAHSRLGLSSSWSVGG